MNRKRHMLERRSLTCTYRWIPCGRFRLWTGAGTLGTASWCGSSSVRLRPRRVPLHLRSCRCNKPRGRRSQTWRTWAPWNRNTKREKGDKNDYFFSPAIEKHGAPPPTPTSAFLPFSRQKPTTSVTFPRVDFVPPPIWSMIGRTWRKGLESLAGETECGRVWCEEEQRWREKKSGRGGVEGRQPRRAQRNRVVTGCLYST